MTTFGAYDRIFTERGRQAHVWGSPHDDNHTLPEWAGLIAKYTGRFAEAAVEGHAEIAEASAVKLGALAVSFIDTCDRQRAVAAVGPDIPKREAELAATVREVEAQLQLYERYANHVASCLNCRQAPLTYTAWHRENSSPDGAS